MVLLPLLVACRPEPAAVDSWHGPIRVERLLRADATCDESAATPIEPVEDYLFTAVLDGTPPISSLYWCRTATDCPPAPFATVFLDALTERRLAGVQLVEELFLDECTVVRDDVEATQDGARVSLVYRWLRADVGASSEDDCRRQAGPLEDDCDEVLVVEGTRVP